jgi:hypothetical protein
MAGRTGEGAWAVLSVAVNRATMRLAIGGVRLGSMIVLLVQDSNGGTELLKSRVRGPFGGDTLPSANIRCRICGGRDSAMKPLPA